MVSEANSSSHNEAHQESNIPGVFIPPGDTQPWRPTGATNRRTTRSQSAAERTAATQIPAVTSNPVHATAAGPSNAPPGNPPGRHGLTYLRRTATTQAEAPPPAAPTASTLLDPAVLQSTRLGLLLQIQECVEALGALGPGYAASLPHIPGLLGPNPNTAPMVPSTQPPGDQVLPLAQPPPIIQVPSHSARRAEANMPHKPPPRLDNVHQKNDQGNERKAENSYHSEAHTVDQALLDLQRRVQEIENAKKSSKRAPSTMAPFARWIMEAPPQPRLKIPAFDKYSGVENARDHVHAFEAIMSLVSHDDDVLCKAFVSALTATALAWFLSLPAGSVESWDDLRKKFVDNFSTAGDHKKRPTDLANVKQGPTESSMSFYHRFRDLAEQIEGITDDMVMVCFTAGMQASQLRFEFDVRPPESKADLYERAYRVARSEANKNAQGDYRSDKKREVVSDRGEERSRRDSNNKGKNRTRLTERREEKSEDFTPLNRTNREIMNLVEFYPPRPLVGNEEARRATGKWCGFHKDYGHDTENCMALKRAIQYKVDNGELDRFIKYGAKRKGDAQRGESHDEERREAKPGKVPRKKIGVIHEESLSNTALKNQIYSLKKVPNVPAWTSKKEEVISFSPNELAASRTAREQPLIVTGLIDNCETDRLLIDTGAARDILYYKCFKEMDLSDSMLIPYPGRLEGFTNHKVDVKGTIDLVLEIGEEPYITKENVTFMVIDVLSDYHAILGIPSQVKMGMVVSLSHQRAKFPTPAGIGCIRGRAKEFLEYVMETRKTKRKYEVESPDKRATVSTSSKVTKMDVGAIFEIKTDEEINKAMNDLKAEVNSRITDEAPHLPNTEIEHLTDIIVDTLQFREGPELRPVDDLEELVINPDYPEQKVKVGKHLSRGERSQLVNLLEANTDVFAWKVEDMRGIKAEIALHELNIDPNFKPIRQKRRVFSIDKQKAIKEEVNKLLRAGIIQEVYYPSWLANVVMVKKANGKWRMCVDFTDLNKACPKDSYPLPRIDKLVDSIAGHRMLSFLDAYSGYHQIKMADCDIDHTAFQTSEGTYSYRMMPFGLKNAGATYQRMVNKVFGSQIGRNMEAYIDDMVIKTKGTDHCKDLKETFGNLRAHEMKLNPSKCVFGVTAGKFLGFMVSQRGIEANPEKIEALLNMKEPTTVKDVQRLNGRVAALGRFISKSAERSLPFFKALKGCKDFKWTEECSTAFKELKEYISQPPLLSSPLPGETLYIHLSASDRAVAAVLSRFDTTWKPVFYASKALNDVEARYFDAEKLAYSLVVAARKLRAYFSAHPIVVYTNSPLRKILSKPDCSGRLLNWAIELTEFDISYQPRKTLQVQPLVDFLVETTFSESPIEDIEPKPVNEESFPSDCWSLYTDGSASKESSGAGVLLIEPGTGCITEKALRFGFPASNNQAEYEALVAGIDLAISMGIRNLVAHTDSKLVVNQLSGEYATVNPTLLQYKSLIDSLIKQLDFWCILQIPREENSRADTLSKLATTKVDQVKQGSWIEFLSRPAIEREKIMKVGEPVRTWVDEFVDFIEREELPTDEERAKMIKKKAARFTVLQGVLYRRSFVKPLLRCVPTNQTENLLAEVHEGVCGGHPGARTLAEKLITMGYYWPTMRADARTYVQKCDKCQRYSNIPRASSTEQTPVVSSWPFEMWGIDFVGPFPTARGNLKMLVVAVDYFTRWIEAKPLHDITEENTINFVHDFIWCRFGLPRYIVSDRGTQFSDSFTAECRRMGVKHAKSSVSHPQGNGQAEAANKILIESLRKTLTGKAGRWVDELPAVLWAIRTTTRGPTGETPFALTYGSEAMAPAELVIHTPRVTFFDEDKNEERRRIELDFLEEKRTEALLRSVNYKQKTKSYHDRKVNKRSFQVGDWVLRKIEATGRRTQQNKLSPKWEGPFIVTKVVREGTYKLKTDDGQELKNPWHADHLRKYYP